MAKNKKNNGAILTDGLALGNNEKLLRTYKFTRYIDDAKKKQHGIPVGFTKLTVTNERLIQVNEVNQNFSRREYPLSGVYGVSYAYTPPKIKSKGGKAFGFIFCLILTLLFAAAPYALTVLKTMEEDYYAETSVEEVQESFLPFDLSIIPDYFDYIAYGAAGFFGFISFILLICLMIKQKDNSNFAFEISLSSEKLMCLGAGVFKSTGRGGENDLSYLRGTPECVEMMQELGSIIQKNKNHEAL